jgi:hypothetical protein
LGIAELEITELTIGEVEERLELEARQRFDLSANEFINKIRSGNWNGMRLVIWLF